MDFIVYFVPYRTKNRQNINMRISIYWKDVNRWSDFAHILMEKEKNTARRRFVYLDEEPEKKDVTASYCQINH